MKTQNKQQILTGYIFSALDFPPKKVNYVVEKLGGVEYCFEFQPHWKQKGQLITTQIHANEASCWRWAIQKFEKDLDNYRENMRLLKKSIKAAKKQLSACKSKKKVKKK